MEKDLSKLNEKDLSTLKIKIWDEKQKKWVKHENDVQKGIYLIIFKPNENIYEIKNHKVHPAEQNKHEIEGGTVVFKPGKFTNKLKNRFFTPSSGYAYYWKYHYERQKGN